MLMILLPGNPQHDWQACYSLMLKAVLGYDLDLTSELAPDTGWPTLQVYFVVVIIEFSCIRMRHIHGVVKNV